MGSTEANMLKAVVFCVGSLQVGLSWGVRVPSQGSSAPTDFQEEKWQAVEHIETIFFSL